MDDKISEIPVDTNASPVSQTPTSVVPVKPAKHAPVLLYIALVLALLITGAAYAFNLTQKQSIDTQLAVVPIPKPLFLTIGSPKANVTAVNGEIIVSGNTLPNTTVVIYSDTDETSVDSSADGTFDTSITVDEEGGPIKITAFGGNGEEKSETVIVGTANELSFAGSDVLGKTDTAPGQVKKTSVTTTAVKNEQQTQNTPKVKAIPTKKPVQEAVVILEKKINTAKINTFLETKTVKIYPPKMGPAKIKEILSLEATDSSKVKGAIRLEKMLAREATPATQLKRHAVQGVITAISGEIITISHQTQRERTFTIYTNAATSIKMKDTATATVADLRVGMRIAAVGEPVNDGILANRIHVIPGNAIGVFKKNPIATEGGTLTPSPEATVTASPTLSPTLEATVTETPTETPVPTETPIPTP